MSTVTRIEWTDRTWGPVLGCEKVSPGCDHCYAIRTAHRCAHLPATRGLYAGLTGRPDGGGPIDWTGRITTVPARLADPLGWRKPQRVFVNSQSDLFHAEVPEDFVVRVLAVMAVTPRHTYQVLTKRHARMRSLLSSREIAGGVDHLAAGIAHDNGLTVPEEVPWPLPNLHLGVSVEDQRWADIRIPALLETPAAVRWVSTEPLLGPVDLRPGEWIHEPDCVQLDDCQCMPTQRRLDWVVCGGESGPGARPMHPDWVRGLRDQCAAGGVPFLFKQWGGWAPAPWKGDGGATHAFTGGFYREGNAWLEGFMELGHSPTSSERDDHTPAGAQGMRRVGKKAAGRELDGVVHDAYPSAVGYPLPKGGR